VDYEDCDDCNKECSRSCSQFLGENWEPANFDGCKNIPLPGEKKVDCKIIDYWEIFYIGNKGKSWNTDRFGQSFLENDSEGTIIQIGYAYFFPYNKPVKQYKEVVELTQPIKKIFGQFVDIHNIKSANGLPASTDQPEMVGLKPIENVIVHKLTAKWGNHESKSQFHQNEGWDTVVVEESFGGSQVYKDFPWEYKKDRPFYFDADQWNEIGLNRKLDYKSPKFKCSLCKTFHFKGDWFVHHDDLPPAGFSPDTEIYSRPDSP